MILVIGEESAIAVSAPPRSTEGVIVEMRAHLISMRNQSD